MLNSEPTQGEFANLVKQINGVENKKVEVNTAQIKEVLRITLNIPAQNLFGKWSDFWRKGSILRSMKWIDHMIIFFINMMVTGILIFFWKEVE